MISSIDNPSPSPVIIHTDRSGFATFTPVATVGATSMNGVKPISIHVVWETATTTNSTHHNKFFTGNPQLRQKFSVPRLESHNHRIQDTI